MIPTQPSSRETTYPTLAQRDWIDGPVAGRVHFPENLPDIPVVAPNDREQTPFPQTGYIAAAVKAGDNDYYGMPIQGPQFNRAGRVAARYWSSISASDIAFPPNLNAEMLVGDIYIHHNSSSSNRRKIWVYGRKSDWHLVPVRALDDEKSSSWVTHPGSEGNAFLSVNSHNKPSWITAATIQKQRTGRVAGNRRRTRASTAPPEVAEVAEDEGLQIVDI
ncbi:hypothetical protein CYLTODRAFT_415341 [Cylindrobasidium torrendii FP15055 ss-10]|uniref:Uncharacterized protein n=1 Tax=Cylindrobasidium torrendii FP15055 ss-10 TaxID=1314674 RepID=A0A0D7ATM5_9AGAR|nr:hypothetical protein CYLTODRAFT_415341 [Cylindrobasidium torrendii FP15055 ss-10]